LEDSNSVVIINHDDNLACNAAAVTETEGNENHDVINEDGLTQAKQAGCCGL
jgi:hypothetical protein